MGLIIKTDDKGIRVWRSDKFGFPQYSVITGKTDSGRARYQDVQFRKGVELENGTDILIDYAFPTTRSWRDKQTGEEKSRDVWMVTEFRYMPEVAEPELESVPEDVAAVFSAVDDSTPF